MTVNHVVFANAYGVCNHAFVGWLNRQSSSVIASCVQCYLCLVVLIVLITGEREFVKDNKSLGNFRLDGIPPAPRGVPQVEVKFDIDANGILSVTATDKGTQKKQDIKITGASTLNSDEVDRMVQEAEKYSAEDKTKRDAIETKNQVYLYSTSVSSYY